MASVRIANKGFIVMTNKEDLDKRERIIRILGSGVEKDREIEHYKDFHCYGRVNVDNICGNCNLRFRCFTDREYIEIPIKETHRRSLRNVTVQNIIDMLANDVLEEYVRVSKDKQGRGHAQLSLKRRRAKK